MTRTGFKPKRVPNPAHSGRGRRSSPPESGWNARAALSRAGLTAKGEARATRQAGAAALDTFSGRAGFGGLLIWAGASIVGLAILDTMLQGRGPGAYARLLEIMGKGIKILVDPGDPIVARAEAPAFTPADLGTLNAAAADVGAFGDSLFGGPASKLGAYPLGRQGLLIGSPGQGTHSYSSPPNNWESDNAVDLRVPVGTPVYAVTGGKISDSLGFGDTGQGGRFAGKRLHLVTPQGTFYYAHLSRIVVRPGQKVREGQLIGYSGEANGVPHLHLAVSYGHSILAWIKGFIPAYQGSGSGGRQ